MSTASTLPWRPDHPRIRGEHVGLAVKPGDCEGSSPHTRGARRSLSIRGVEARIIPAYAGSTVMTSANVTIQGDHPRIRGEHSR